MAPAHATHAPPPTTSDLFNAIGDGDVPAFAAALESLDIDPSIRDSSGNTPLHAAVQSGNAGMVTAFVQSRHGRNAGMVHARDAHGETAVWNAARNGQVAMLAPLVAAGAQINGRGKQGETPLTAAVLSNRLDMVQALIAAGADVDADNDVPHPDRSTHNTPLMLAMRVANPDVVRALIAAGADVNAYNDNLDTPLTFVQGHEVGLSAAGEMADALLAVMNAGASLMVRHHEGFDDTALAYLAVQFPRLSTPLLAAQEHSDAAAYQRLTAFVDAAEGGDLAQVRTLLGGVADIDARVASGATALTGAARYGNPEVVLALLGAGANPDAADGFGRTPLMLAARNSHPGLQSEQVLQALLKARADITACDRSGNTVLMPDSVFSRLHMHAALALLQAGVNINARNYRGETALLGALRVGASGLATWLLQWRADINLPCHRGSTALMRVVKRQEDLTPWINARADVNARNHRGQTALFIAGTFQHAPAVAVLVAGGADINAEDHNGETPLMAAAYAGCLETATAMLRARAFIHASDKAGVTVLMHAVRHGRGDFIHLLLTHIAQQAVSRLPRHLSTGNGLVLAHDAGPLAVQAAVNARDFLNNTALLHAARIKDGAWPVVALLLDAGADVNAQNAAGMTALMFLVHGNPEAALLLLARGGIVIEKVDARGSTALMHAAPYGSPDLLAALIQAGAHVDILNGYAYINAKDVRGATALMHAATHGNHLAVRLLLDQDADINARDKRGATALIHAAISGHLPVVLELLERNPDVHIEDENLHTAVLHAALRQHEHVVAALEAHASRQGSGH